MQELQAHKVDINEWDKLRDIRTRAIIDSPQAFGDTLEETLARTEDQWKGWIRNNIYVVEDNARFVASATWWKKHPEYGDYIVGVWTDSKYRGKGLNKKLFEQIFTDAKSAGVTKISLHVNIDQLAAVNSYKNLGFEIAGTVLQKKMGDGKLYDEYLMEKSL